MSRADPRIEQIYVKSYNDHITHLVGIRFGCHNVVLEVVLVHEVAACFGKREIVRVRVFRLEVKVKVPVYTDVQGGW